MALRIVQKLAGSALRPQVIRSSSIRSYSLFEPDYLELSKSKLPLLDPLNIQITSYDYCILENYQRLVYNLTSQIGIEIENSWALPPKEIEVQKFKPNSSIIDAEYKLKKYFRVIQIIDAPAITYPILLRMIEASLPEGVTLNVIPHTPEQEEVRYVPDRDLIELKNQLDSQGGPSTKKKR